MMRSRWETLGGFLLGALLFSPAWGSVTPQPGMLNYIEGQAAIGSQTLSETSVGTAKLATGQSLSTADGRAEILLTPGIFVRIDDNSSLRMISPGLADTGTRGIALTHSSRAMGSFSTPSAGASTPHGSPPTSGSDTATEGSLITEISDRPTCPPPTWLMPALPLPGPLDTHTAFAAPLRPL